VPFPASAPAAPQPPPPPPQKFAGHRLIVIYFDLDGVPAELQTRAISASAGFIREQMQPNDLVAIMTATPGIKVVEDFTFDRDRLVAGLGKLSFDTNSDAAGLDGLLSATKLLRPLPNKKALVYFATPASRQSLAQAQIQTVIEAAQSANVAFYPIDISALPAADRK
jgi:VWFA-related protein